MSKLDNRYFSFWPGGNWQLIQAVWRKTFSVASYSYMKVGEKIMNTEFQKWNGLRTTFLIWLFLISTFCHRQFMSFTRTYQVAFRCLFRTSHAYFLIWLWDVLKFQLPFIWSTISIKITYCINPSHATGVFLCPLKTSENQMRANALAII